MTKAHSRRDQATPCHAKQGAQTRAEWAHVMVREPQDCARLPWARTNPPPNKHPPLHPQQTPRAMESQATAHTTTSKEVGTAPHGTPSHPNTIKNPNPSPDGGDHRPMATSYTIKDNKCWCAHIIIRKNRNNRDGENRSKTGEERWR